MWNHYCAVCDKEGLTQEESDEHLIRHVGEGHCWGPDNRLANDMTCLWLTVAAICRRLSK